jgi:hypothetical protein
MFCPNCGKDCKDAKFCSECGTRLIVGAPIEYAENDSYEIPIGIYSGYQGYIQLGKDSLVISNRRCTTEIPYRELTAVRHVPGGLGGGFFSVRYEKNKHLHLPESFNEALDDDTSIHTVMPRELVFYHICCFLYTFVDQNECAAPAFAIEKKKVSMHQIDVSVYYEKYNPYRDKAIEALKADAAISKTDAKIIIHDYFDKCQRIEYAQNPAATLRDLDRILNLPQKRLKEQMDASNLAYCPRCLSTDISGEKRGFSISRALVGNNVVPVLGMMLGALGADTVECKCLKCGHTWRPKNNNR